MPRTDRESDALKKALKAAFTETLQEQRELPREVFVDAMEDLALAEAIREGQKTKPATRNEVFRVLQGDASTPSEASIRA